MTVGTPSHDGSALHVPTGPGLGVAVDEAELPRYTAGSDGDASPAAG